ncbi:MFS transporter [Streptomyces sp. Tu 3180]|uniref:MFS transporter n=1 Tax=Streptomyces sp. Tu 3180 TaxID=2682611 RepID=UPI002441C317|nr:MFS transporter [Streptomyces sp. Tu 3180]
MTTTRACAARLPCPAPHTRHWPAVTTAALTATVTVMPGFTVGALAPALESGLGLSRSAIGLALSCFYAATALGSPIARRVAARFPVHRVLAAAALSAAAVMLGASQATGMISLTVLLLLGGLSNALVQPAVGRLIAARTPAHRRSLAAGVVGAALAAATFVPGLLVALVLPAHGWRVSLLTAGLVALLVTALAPLARAPLEPAGPTRTGGHPRTGRTLLLWSSAAALAATGNNAVATYFVHLGTDSGLSPTTAGHLLTASSVLAIAVRVAAGALTDRAPGRNPTVIAAMMCTGGFGLALIAAGTPVAFTVGALLAFSAGWGWTGLLLATALHLVTDQAEYAGHTVQVGIYTGATIAPFAFGAISGALGFTPTALVAATAAFAGAGAITAGAVHLRRSER